MAPIGALKLNPGNPNKQSAKQREFYADAVRVHVGRESDLSVPLADKHLAHLSAPDGDLLNRRRAAQPSRRLGEQVMTPSDVCTCRQHLDSILASIRGPDGIPFSARQVLALLDLSKR